MKNIKIWSAESHEHRCFVVGTLNFVICGPLGTTEVDVPVISGENLDVYSSLFMTMPPDGLLNTAFQKVLDLNRGLEHSVRCIEPEPLKFG